MFYFFSTLDSEINQVLDGTMFFQLHTSNNENFENYLRRRTIAKARKNNRYFAYYIASKHNCSLEVLTLRVEKWLFCLNF